VVGQGERGGLGREKEGREEGEIRGKKANSQVTRERIKRQPNKDSRSSAKK
jgi:hypothetical protein